MKYFAIAFYWSCCLIAILGVVGFWLSETLRLVLLSFPAGIAVSACLTEISDWRKL